MADRNGGGKDPIWRFCYIDDKVQSYAASAIVSLGMEDHIIQRIEI